MDHPENDLSALLARLKVFEERLAKKDAQIRELNLQTVDVVHQAYVLLGAAGTGKIALATALCQWATGQESHRVAVATPTGLLAQAHRHLQQNLNIHVDTAASFFAAGQDLRFFPIYPCLC